MILPENEFFSQKVIFLVFNFLFHSAKSNKQTKKLQTFSVIQTFIRQHKIIINWLLLNLCKALEGSPLSERAAVK